MSAVTTTIQHNTFWFAYVLDKGMCIRFGYHPLKDDDEIGIDIPSPEKNDLHGPNGRGKPRRGIGIPVLG
jgi:hypothetical protein